MAVAAVSPASCTALQLKSSVKSCNVCSGSKERKLGPAMAVAALASPSCTALQLKRSLKSSNVWNGTCGQAGFVGISGDGWKCGGVGASLNLNEMMVMSLGLEQAGFVVKSRDGWKCGGGGAILGRSRMMGAGGSLILKEMMGMSLGLQHFGVEMRTPLGRKWNELRCSASSASRPASQPRFIQHKQEAFWFYRFLSIVYDHIINPGHWTEDMREDALEPAELNGKDLVVVDVGGGTGFATLGIVKTVDAKNVTILDQSPHQLAKAKEKAPLKDCTIIEGDAEDLPFATGYADRYVSAGSIEYWPDPQRGIKEAYRVLKKGGRACLIGPVHPTFWLSRIFADAWMLFPTEEEYMDWFTKAGFTDVQIKRIGPKWYRGVRRHGLIMGCSVSGVKAGSGDSPLQLGPKEEDSKAPFNPLTFAFRFLVGTVASLYYVFIPIYMWLKDLVVPKGWSI